MASYLLIWDPNKWDWRNIGELADQVKRGVPVTKTWSCGTARRIFTRDRIFVMRQGREPRGIIAVGRVTRGSYQAKELETQDGTPPATSFFVDIQFDALIEPQREAVIPRTRLMDPSLTGFAWETRQSGQQLPEDIAAVLEKIWEERLPHVLDSSRPLTPTAGERSRLADEAAGEAAPKAGRVEVNKSKEESKAAAKAKTKADKERAEKERADKERADKERADKERADKERADKERADKERADKERAEKERAEKERADKERADKERADKERADKERADKERADKERADKERAEKERAEKERAEKERAEKERAEKERVEKERVEKERVEKERVEKERVEKERVEAERHGAMLDSSPWSGREHATLVADYFAMLRADIQGELYSKVDHREQLKERLDDRSERAIEVRHRNISAILANIGLPIIDGYPPLGDFELELEVAVRAYVEDSPSEIEDIWISGEPPQVKVPETLDDSAQFEVPPPSVEDDIGSTASLVTKGLPRKTDFNAREERNAALVRAGEKFVLAFERARLKEAGKADLAARIEWVSEIRNNGLGYDILSYETDGSERYIKVKTTNYGARFPYTVTASEVLFSRDNANQYHLYRVFLFSKAARLFIAKGSLQDGATLTPVTYRATC